MFQGANFGGGNESQTKSKYDWGLVKAAARHAIADTIYNQSKTCTSGSALWK